MKTLFLPPAYQDSAESGRLILRDGSAAFIRPSRPEDLDGLRRFFHGLSPESKRRRFFSVADPPESLLARLCDSSDPGAQLTLIVTRVVADVSRIIATASYVARDETSAEVAFAVEDEFQGKGLGGLLLERLALLAASNGLVRFWALTRAENQLMLDTFRSSGFPIHSRADDGCVEIDFSVAPSEDSVQRSETRDRVFTTASLRPFFRPRSVAVLGASADESSPGRRILEALVAAGFRGPVHAVEPGGVARPAPGVAVATRIPEGTDLAIVATRREEILTAVDECASARVRALVVATSASDESDAAGRALADELMRRARDRGMRVVGPGSVGLINTDPDVRLNASLFPALPANGSLAISSQSGGVGLVMLDLAERRRLGVSTFIGVGEKADISGNDLLQYWQGDEATRVILLYVESFGNPRRFARIARAVSRVKPIVVVKAGRRTGRLAPEDEIAPVATGVGPVDALFRQTGVIRAETLEEMFDLAAVLERQPLPAGRRVAILSDAAGPDTVCADACRSAGLSVPAFSGEISARLATSLPPSGKIGNPLELPSHSSPETYRRVVEALLAAEDTDALIAIHAGLGGDFSTGVVQAIRQGVGAARAAGIRAKPVLACLLVPEDVGFPLAAEGIPVYAFPESAAAVLGKFATYGVWRAGPHGVIPAFDDIDPASARAICRKAIEGRAEGWLPPEATAAVLSAFRLPVEPGGLGGSSDAAGIEQATAPPMPSGGVELKVSVIEDPSFGPLIRFGLAGDHAEAIGDASVRVTPLTDRAAAAMVRQIRQYPVLEGYMGSAPADIPAVHDLLLRVSRLIEEVPEIAELELAPVVAGSPGRGCEIRGGRIRVALPRKGQPPRYTTTSPVRASGPAESTILRGALMPETIDRELLYRTIVEHSPIAILFADREGRIRFWNAGAESVFGYAAAEAVGQSLDLIIPEKQRPRHWEGWNRVMETGVTRYGRDVLAVPAMKKDGTRISIEFYILLLRGQAGEITGAAAMIQDVTARWNQFKELRARIAALEARSAETAKAG